MSARRRPARKSAGIGLSYAEQPTSSSSEDAEDALSDSGREGGAGATKGKRKVVGTLNEVLTHQHLVHNGASCLSSAKQFVSEPELRIQLPLEVACAMDAVLDLAKLDPETATRDDLDAFDKVVVQFELDNATAKTRHFWAGGHQWSYGSPGWEKLLRGLKVEADRNAKLKKPVAIEPPVVVCHVVHAGVWARPPLTGPSSASAKKRKRTSKGKGKSRLVVADSEKDEVDQPGSESWGSDSS
ncbi:hypothetical protein DMC30DRAFT_429680 [Rhodotorula diobovata]|uniref:Uncharacterized protein n=1 Tax=Rhodotorula diobovata TaxID=5288 RepID=A0A5C5G4K5_9BASI|nr:hypothetical protein DMC30DRAFT_429680 [Rhodotorula diobovata]